jgi:hypothetical protein
MQLLGAEVGAMPTPPSPQSGRRAPAVLERALSPTLVDHIIAALHGRHAPSGPYQSAVHAYGCGAAAGSIM